MSLNYATSFADDGSTAGIIGGVVGGLIVVCLIVIVICILLRRRSFDGNIIFVQVKCMAHMYISHCFCAHSIVKYFQEKLHISFIGVIITVYLVHLLALLVTETTFASSDLRLFVT